MTRTKRKTSRKKDESGSSASSADADVARAYEERPALAVAYRSSPPCPYCKCEGSRVLKTWVQPYAGKDRTRWQYKSCADEPGDHANGDAGHRFYVWWPLR